MATLMKTCFVNSTSKLCGVARSRCLNYNIFQRYYDNYSKRKPLRVIQQKDGNSIPPRRSTGVHQFKQPDDEVVREKATEWRHVKSKDYFSESAQKSMMKDRASKEKFKLPDHILYKTLEEGDGRCGPIIMAAKSKKLRYKENIILLEGKRLVIDAIYSGVEIQAIYFDTVDNLEGLPFDDFRTNFFKIKSSHMKIWSDLGDSPGILAICKLPEPLKYEEGDLRVPTTLILENIRDPGVMGVLLRTAAAVGCDKVIALKGCVDVWEPKVIRSGAGSHFKSCIIPHIGWEEVGGHIPEESFVLLADTDTGEQNEFEKLNKSERQSLMKAITSIETNVYTEVDDVTNISRDIDENFLKPEIVNLYRNAPLSVLSLFDVNLKKYPHVTVIIGGESHDISNQAKKFTFDKNGHKLYIPMHNDTQILSSSIAGSLILYEAKRQLLASFKSGETSNVDS